MRIIRVAALAAAAALATSWPASAKPRTTSATVTGTGWSAFTIDVGPPFGQPLPLTAIACPKTGLCLAGGGLGDVIVSTDPTGGQRAWRNTATRFAPGGSGQMLELDCPTASFCLAVMDYFGPSPYRVFASTNPAGGHGAWHAMSLSLPPEISCTGPHLCATPSTDRLGVLTTTNPAAGSGTVWKTTRLLQRAQVVRIDGVSCASSSMCVAVDDAGDVYASKTPTGGARTWKSVPVDSSALKDLACSPTSFCIALDAHGALVYSSDPTGGKAAWHTTTVPAGISGISCLSATFCYGTGPGGALFSSDPAAGSSSWLASDISFNALACASPSLCAAVDQAGDVLTSTDPTGGAAAWSSALISGVSMVQSLGCSATSLCVAFDNAGNVISSARPAGGASAWHQAYVGDSDVLAASCPGAALCVAVDSNGNVLWSTDPTGGPSAWQSAPVDSSVQFVSVACPTVSVCVAGGSDGTIATSTDPTGGSPGWQAASVGAVGHLYVSCPNASECVATGRDAIYASTNPAAGAGSWSRTAVIPNAHGIGAVSCPAVSLCVASANYNGHATVLSTRHPTGGSGGWLAASGGAGVPFGGRTSCPDASFCLVSPGPGGVFESTDPAGGSPSDWLRAGISGSAVLGFDLPTQLACPSRKLCVVAAGDQVQTGFPPGYKTSTATRVSAVRVRFGHERHVRISVSVTSAYRARIPFGVVIGVPMGVVVIGVLGKTVCRLALQNGKASCALHGRQLKPGKYRLAARYLGAVGSYRPSSSRPVHLTVTR